MNALHPFLARPFVSSLAGEFGESGFAIQFARLCFPDFLFAVCHCLG
ncbi:MAG: hypothetical protein ACR2HF_02820 [Methylococcaceae bacterium]